jgi:hypothetical protein
MQLKRSAETAFQSKHYNNCASLLVRHGPGVWHCQRQRARTAAHSFDCHLQTQALQLAPQSKELKLLQAEAEIKAGNTGDAERTCSCVELEREMAACASENRGPAQLIVI